jgi:hypothetical protein
VAVGEGVFVEGVLDDTGDAEAVTKAVLVAVGVWVADAIGGFDEELLKKIKTKTPMMMMAPAPMRPASASHL